MTISEMRAVEWGILALLAWLGLGLTVVGWLLWRVWQRTTAPKVWDVVEVAEDGQTTRRQRVREAEPGPPWSSAEVGIRLPASWAYDWPDPAPEPAKLPDEERA
jgi:hypothetical protein